MDIEENLFKIGIEPIWIKDSVREVELFCQECEAGRPYDLHFDNFE